MRIIGNLCEIIGITIWLTKEVSWMLDNSYGITELILATKIGQPNSLGNYENYRVYWLTKKLIGYGVIRMELPD